MKGSVSMSTGDSGEHPKIDPVVELVAAVRSLERVVQETGASVTRDVSALRDGFKGITMRLTSLEGRVSALESTKRGESLNTRREHLEHAREEIRKALDDLDRELASDEAMERGDAPR